MTKREARTEMHAIIEAGYRRGALRWGMTHCPALVAKIDITMEDLVALDGKRVSFKDYWVKCLAHAQAWIDVVVLFDRAHDPA